MKNEPYNLGLDDANLSKDELAHKIKEHLPRLKIYYDEFAADPDKRNYIVSNEKIAKAGFRATFGLDEGIKELIKGYKVLLVNNPYGND